ncbi:MULTISPECIES: dUTP diphosphatase [unclassified Mycoplasma]|uniref:dUTP diphosphatase n=1 Tax=unclassified Mycoplasma TaxID=2683645 RepID=UPI00211BE3F1|nr:MULTISPECIES: dUTP diphosphatase [unclassified Mycoplasma]UUM19636.1 dUTP diphosphatase [Mycoplasma sp. 1578d]UUM24605.1 dUTP diphosphatase [Mycoplasma sp. 3686d]
MNLSRIFEMQKDLDEKIKEKSVDTDPNLSEDQIIMNGTIALIVEASEFANEIQSFKYWKKNKNIDNKKVLEEFADLVHFLVSFSNRYNVPHQIEPIVCSSNLNLQLQNLFIALTKIMQNPCKETVHNAFRIAIGTFEMLGFTYEQLCSWYIVKNQTNYQRILNNY